ncbi:MAG: GGGtGRT protein [Ruthenibacterium lactatiformans]
MRTWTFPSPATPPTPPASSIWWPAPIKKWAIENGKKYFSVASGGGTGRTLHPDNMAAGPASYGLTDSMGRMHGDAQFAGSSSVPAHVEMMGLIGMGNNPMVGATVACAVAASQA